MVFNIKGICENFSTSHSWKGASSTTGWKVKKEFIFAFFNIVIFFKETLHISILSGMTSIMMQII